MTLNDLRHTLSSEQLIQKDPFAVLQAISEYINDPDSEFVARELVIRALDKRDSFRGLDEVVAALTRQVGLFPYLAENELSPRDLIAYELHRPPAMEDTFVFHRLQAEVYWRLMGGENVILSAPTSFGKSKIIDAVIATRQFDNVVVIVPTIALIDETRRRLATFKDPYKIVTQVSQEPADKNIFVFTAERAIAYRFLPEIDFFVIDEFYKIGAIAEDETRTVALNQAFYRLFKSGAQFYMLGPNIQHIPKGLEGKFKCYFLSTHFATVVNEIIPVTDWTDEIERLIALAEDIDEQTLVYCRSPKRVNDVARALVERAVAGHWGGFEDVGEWVSDNYHPEWIYQAGLRAGIGIHHGKLPRSLAQFVVNAFNEGRIRYLVCTSTLIEGVNTSARNVIILDDVIGGQRFDYFTFNNIKGRSGRMFRHFIGKVYVFHAPPEEELPFVDFPVFTQEADAPESLLVQLDEEELSARSRERLEGVYEQRLLPVEVIRSNGAVDPRAQINLAEVFANMNREAAAGYWWTGLPSSTQLYAACELIWNVLTTGRGRSGVLSWKQLAFKTQALMYTQNIRERVEDELKEGRYQAKSADEAVERVLEFDRNWASFELPRLFMCFSNIQRYIFSERFGSAGDYSFFATRLEALFRNPVAAALEEYGLPMQVTDRISRQIPLSDEIDAALEEVKMLPADQLGLSAFEERMLRITQDFL